MPRPSHSPPASRREALRDGLPVTVGLLKQRLACDIPAGYLEDYLALDWLEWHGGSLRLTTTGHNICQYAIFRRNKAA